MTAAIARLARTFARQLLQLIPEWPHPINLDDELDLLP